MGQVKGFFSIQPTMIRLKKPQPNPTHVDLVGHFFYYKKKKRSIRITSTSSITSDPTIFQKFQA